MSFRDEFTLVRGDAFIETHVKNGRRGIIYKVDRSPDQIKIDVMWLTKDGWFDDYSREDIVVDRSSPQSLIRSILGWEKQPRPKQRLLSKNVVVNTNTGEMVFRGGHDYPVYTVFGSLVVIGDEQLSMWPMSTKERDWKLKYELIDKTDVPC